MKTIKIVNPITYIRDEIDDWAERKDASNPDWFFNWVVGFMIAVASLVTLGIGGAIITIAAG